MDFTGDAPGIAVTRTHFKSEACVSMLRAEACTGDIPPPVTNNTGWTSSWEGETCWKPIMRRVYKAETLIYISRISEGMGGGGKGGE